MDGALTDAETGCLDLKKEALDARRLASYFLSGLSAISLSISSLYSTKGRAPTIILTRLTRVPSLTPSSRVGVPVIPELLAFGDAALDFSRVFAAQQAFLEGFSLEPDRLCVRHQGIGCPCYPG
ncbi:MAG: hypothetical protein ACREYF_28300 [Gammaproteobacteria bacterium]